MEAGAFIPFTETDELGLGDIGLRGRYVFPEKKHIAWGGQAGLDLPTGDAETGHGRGLNIHLGGLFTWTSPEIPLKVHADARFVFTGKYDFREVDLGPLGRVKAEADPDDYLLLGGGVSYRAAGRVLVLGELVINAYGSDGSALGGGVAYAAGRSFNLNGGLFLGLGSSAPDLNVLIGATTTFSTVVEGKEKTAGASAR